MLAEGDTPEDYHVHHIIPLDDEGGNEFTNLILIRALEHTVITAYQNAFTRQLEPDDIIAVDFPVPPPDQTVWPPSSNQVPAEQALWRAKR